MGTLALSHLSARQEQRNQPEGFISLPINPIQLPATHFIGNSDEDNSRYKEWKHSDYSVLDFPS